MTDFPQHPDLQITGHEIAYRRHLRLDVYRFRHRLYSGDWSGERVWDVVRRGAAVAVLLYYPDREAVVLVEQFRLPPLLCGYSPWVIEAVAGLVDRNNESLEQVARRETAEEAGARVELEGLYSMINVVRVGQVHLFYRARMLDVDFVPGPESLEARLFAEEEVPWDEIAFRTTKRTLEFFFADRRAGRYEFHAADIG